MSDGPFWAAAIWLGRLSWAHKVEGEHPLVSIDNTAAIPTRIPYRSGIEAVLLDRHSWRRAGGCRGRLRRAMCSKPWSTGNGNWLHALRGSGLFAVAGAAVEIGYRRGWRLSPAFLSLGSVGLERFCQRPLRHETSERSH